MKTMQAYKRSPALENSTWYKGLLISQLAGSSETDGAFDLVESKMKKGTEPPPHIHDLTATMAIFIKYGVRMLSPAEVADQLPAYPTNH